jgi:hypothetical protein
VRRVAENFGGGEFRAAKSGQPPHACRSARALAWFTFALLFLGFHAICVLPQLKQFALQALALTAEAGRRDSDKLVQVWCVCWCVRGGPSHAGGIWRLRYLGPLLYLAPAAAPLTLSPPLLPSLTLPPPYPPLSRPGTLTTRHRAPSTLQALMEESDELRARVGRLTAATAAWRRQVAAIEEMAARASSSWQVWPLSPPVSNCVSVSVYNCVQLCFCLLSPPVSVPVCGAFLRAFLCVDVCML